MWGFMAVSVCIDMREGDDQFPPDRVRREWDDEGKLRVTFLIRTRFSLAFLHIPQRVFNRGAARLILLKYATPRAIWHIPCPRSERLR